MVSVYVMIGGKALAALTLSKRSVIQLVAMAGAQAQIQFTASTVSTMHGETTWENVNASLAGKTSTALDGLVSVTHDVLDVLDLRMMIVRHVYQIPLQLQTDLLSIADVTQNGVDQAASTLPVSVVRIAMDVMGQTQLIVNTVLSMHTKTQ